MNETTRNPRPIAFFLPQFHPIPENDRWWGEGFTEWTNVRRAKPRFRGHEQPRLPADEIGFYDLRSPEAREKQADLARAHGIHAFCWYHYWFAGRRLLERPFGDVLSSGRPDFPFCLCWANESWTRAWEGRDDEVLVQQTYSEDDDRRHIEALLPALADPRYVRVRGRPLLLVYRASDLPDPRRTVDLWRASVRAAGLGDLYLAAVEAFDADRGLAPRAGFDAAVEFAPDWSCIGRGKRRGRLARLARRLGLSSRAYEEARVVDYDEVAARMLARPSPSYLRFPGVSPSWDNSARRPDGFVLHGSTPQGYARWLEAAILRFEPPHPDEDLVFVNAWNEWGEGAHLEPCRRHGRAYLEATHRALESVHRSPSPR